MRDINEIITEALVMCGKNTARLAAELSVSEVTVIRWKNGESHPRPIHESAMKRMIGSLRLSSFAIAEQGELYKTLSKTEAVSNALNKTLAEIREILHRRGGLSSRNEALEEVGVLLFAHVYGVNSGNGGLEEICISHTDAAKNLQNLVKKALTSRRLDKLFINGNKEYLKLGSDKDVIALEIVNAFRPMFAIRDKLVACEYDILNDIYGRFIADSFIDEKEFGQYLTPPEVVEFMVRLAASTLSESELKDYIEGKSNSSQLILDPSCGVGSFLTAIAREINRRANTLKISPETGILSNKILQNNCVGIDKSERMWRLAQLNFAMFGQQNPKLHLANALLRSGDDARVTKDLEGRARLILTNPPFGATFTNDDILKYRIVNSWCRRLPRKVDSEILFLERYIDWLKPGGDLFAIVPDSILTNKNIFQDLRRGLATIASVQDVVSLPSVTFATAGTTTKTSVLHLRKKLSPKNRSKTRFAVCSSIGYEVVTRGNQRTKRHVGQSELGIIESELLSDKNTNNKVREVLGIESSPRWDAQFHSSLSGALETKLRVSSNSLLRVSDVAELINERLNPMRLKDKKFLYVEISDIDSRSNIALPKMVLTSKAPSRARKVAKEGDVLVSTVRPERGTVGVLLNNNQIVICTTGLAVLRPKSVSPLTLAILLKSRFVIEQMVKNNIGIAYPAIEDEIIPNIVLPIDREGLDELNSQSDVVISLETEITLLRRKLQRKATEISDKWVLADI